ncbi:ankyrin repeat domain-containing protein [Brevibacillus sp. B_LB10_24]|uniref:ankyrin repeat domain-containing protein n=1 Tax=Brevibacillus sp. B_LB10_24 TaxID=3380645 RepID=UPI0038BAD0DC
MNAREEIFTAVKAGDVEKVESLIRLDPELKQAVAENGDTLLLTAVYHGVRLVVDYLRYNGVAMNIHEAAAVGDLEIVERHLETAPELLDSFSHDGWTPLHLAAHFGNALIARHLLSCGADVNIRSRNSLNNIPLHAAVAGKSPYKLAELLLASGAEVNAKQQGGYTPLHEAVINEDRQTAGLLMGHGADPRLANDKGETALTIAESKGNAALLELLCSGRADLQ